MFANPKSPIRVEPQASVPSKLSEATTFQQTRILRVLLLLLWKLLHLMMDLCFIISSFANAAECFFISRGLLLNPKTIDPNKVKNIAVVMGSEDATNTASIIHLLRWLEAFGAQHVCVFDGEGVIKKAKDSIMMKLNSPTSFKCIVEFLSHSDGKEVVAKAANIILSEWGTSRTYLNESRLDDVLRVVGSWGPDPDLLLVCGRVRCHLGFPAWRMRYTEIVHVGPLGTVTRGALLKAIHRFVMVRQNYGK